MALSSLERARVRMYLGYERGYDLSSELESKLDALDTDETTLVQGVLTKLAALDTQIDTATAAPTVLSVDQGDVVFRDTSALDELATQGRRLIARLVALLRVTPATDYYSAEASTGPVAAVIPLG